MNPRTRLAFLLVLIALNLVIDLRAASEAARTQYNLDASHLALQGYDPVAYFDGKPLKGREDITVDRAGVVYRFASDEHRKQFQESPQKYEPAYGGWCATAMAEGKKVEIDPTDFKITDGRLFVFYKSLLHDARKDWNKKEADLRAKADAHWKEISGE